MEKTDSIDRSLLKVFKLNIQWKMVLVGLVIVAAFLGLIFGYVLPGIQNSLFVEKENVIIHEVESAWSILNFAYQQQEQGMMTDTAARFLAMEQVADLRYGEDGSGYFWIIDTDAYTVINPVRPEMNNQDMGNYKDPDGRAVFVEMADIAQRQGEGIVNYSWQYGADTGRIEPKNGYVKFFEPWGWIVGTEVYSVDVNRASISMRNKYIILGGIIAVLCIGFLFIISRMIGKNIKKAVAITDRLATGDTFQKVNINSSDETGQMGRSLGNLVYYLYGLSQSAERIAQGDLTVTFEPKSEKDTLGNSFVKMVANLRELVKKVDDDAGTIASASAQLAEASEQSGSATEQIAGVSGQIARGAEEQTRGINEVNTAISELGKAIETVSHSSSRQTATVEQAMEIAQQVSAAAEQTATFAQEATTNASQAAEVAKQGSYSVEKTIEDIKKINTSMKNVAEKATELGKHSEEIGGMVAIIDDIASQTNLLALNAAIEAARAGEQGRGFAVVADEVKKLAERTAKETKEISALVNLVQKGVAESVKASVEGAKQADTSTGLANEAGTALIQILDVINKMTEQISGISAAAEEMSAFAQEMVKAVEGVNEIAKQNLSATTNMADNEVKVRESAETVAATIEENSASTQQMSASIQEISAQVQQVVSSSKSLSGMAAELKDVVARFKLNGSGRGSGSNGNGKKELVEKDTVAVQAKN